MKNKILIGLVVFLIIGVIGFNVNMNVKSNSKTSGLTFSKLQSLAFGEGGWDGEGESPDKKKGCQEMWTLEGEDIHICNDNAEIFAIYDRYGVTCEENLQYQPCSTGYVIRGINCDGDREMRFLNETVVCY